MFQRILVPLDGSEWGELALPYAEELARALNSEVELVYVCDPAESQYRHMHQLYIEKIAQQVREHIEEGRPETTVKPVVLDGHPAATVIDYAEKSAIGLIIMATHGRSGIISWAMGSIAHKILYGVSIPVLLIRAGVPSPASGKGGQILNRILVPLDGSEAGEAVLPYVSELTNRLKSEVTLLQVVAPGQHVHTIGGLDYVLFPEQQVESMKVEAKQYLEEAGRKLPDTKGTIRSEVKTGHAAQEIIKLSGETDARLIAMTAHGRSGVGRWTFGSVAQKVLHGGNTPLLLVRAAAVQL